jgi:hypothetical protein
MGYSRLSEESIYLGKLNYVPVTSYVSRNGGLDSNDCSTPLLICESVNVAIGSVNFGPGTLGLVLVVDESVYVISLTMCFFFFFYVLFV